MSEIYNTYEMPQIRRRKYRQFFYLAYCIIRRFSVE